MRSLDTDAAHGLIRIHDYLTKHMKLTTAALHDANLVLSLVLPSDASLLMHFNSLYQVVGDNPRAYAPQNKQILKVPCLKEILKCLQRGGAKFGGVTGNKAVLLERLQNVLRTVKEEGKRTKRSEDIGEEGGDEPNFDHDMTDA